MALANQYLQEDSLAYRPGKAVQEETGIAVRQDDAPLHHSVNHIVPDQAAGFHP